MARPAPHRHSERPPVLLVILDGWGHREEVADNAVAQAHTPHWDSLMRDYPHGLVHASELDVGLPSGQMGNSEVGHMNIGSGRVILQDLPRIDAAIADGSLDRMPELQSLIATLREAGKPCHLMGLFSPGGVHAHQSHVAALAKILSGAGVDVWLHLFLDGRDTPPKSALRYLDLLDRDLADATYVGTGRTDAGRTHAGRIRIGTVCGRYYAMDRDQRWDRVQRAYDMLTAAEAPVARDARSVVEAAYAGGATDEFIQPHILEGYPGMGDGDGLLMANFRADRARQMLTALLDPSFDAFPRAVLPAFSQAVGMVEYSEKLNPFLSTVFAPESALQTLGEIVSAAGRTQLRIAETEKYAHVTFFFNGGVEDPFPGEERILVPSPKVATYDLQPEMSAAEVTDAIVAALARDAFDLVIVNYANSDMVGHSGNLAATAKAVETVDACLGRLMAALEPVQGTMLITADHGNAECMLDEENHQPHTAHTLNLVPALLVGPAFRNRNWTLPEGKLADIAPTLLQLLGIPQPKAMTGQSLLRDAVPALGAGSARALPIGPRA